MRKLKHHIEMTSEITEIIKQTKDQNNTITELTNIDTHKTDEIWSKI